MYENTKTGKMGKRHKSVICNQMKVEIYEKY